MHMRVAVTSHALPIYKKNRIASLLCIFETIIHQGAEHYIGLDARKAVFGCLVCVAEETGLSLALSETPKTGFVASWP